MLGEPPLIPQPPESVPTPPNAGPTFPTFPTFAPPGKVSEKTANQDIFLISKCLVIL